jgi:hypothetical protein
MKEGQHDAVMRIIQHNKKSLEDFISKLASEIEENKAQVLQLVQVLIDPCNKLLFDVTMESQKSMK